MGRDKNHHHAMDDIISVKKDEHKLIGEIIGESFADDPVNKWIYNNSHALIRCQILAAKKLYLKKGFGHRTHAGIGGTLWLSPQTKNYIALWNSLDIACEMIKGDGFRALRRDMLVDDAMSAARPSIPHYYLYAIGVRPGHQGQGIGSRLLKEGLRVVDDAHMPAYLESSNDANVSLYERYGFEVTDVLKPGNGCPPLWLMWRHTR
jgi:GNAT superfamily N-acetyltransferase